MSWYKSDKCGAEKTSSTPSMSALSADLLTSDASRTVSVLGSALPDTSVNMILAPFVNVIENISGDAFTPNTDGTISVNADVGLIEVSIMVKARFSSSDTVTLGVGIGDPLSLPSLPGVIGGLTYVSRFIDSRRGEGATRNQTLSLNHFAVGRTQTIAANTGDKIFPVFWTESATPVSVICKDFIFVIRAVKAVT